jgi:SAM-dependent methyltransferase
VVDFSVFSFSAFQLFPMDPSTLNAYDARASDFAGRYAAADVLPLHRLLLAHLPPGGRLLEIGCGAGRDAVFLAEHGFDVVAADASAAMLDQARNAPGAAFTRPPTVLNSPNPPPIGVNLRDLNAQQPTPNAQRPNPNVFSTFSLLSSFQFSAFQFSAFLF